MRSQIKLGQIFGIRIGLHYSWFLIIFSLASDYHRSHPQWPIHLAATLAIATALLFFFSLLPMRQC